MARSYALAGILTALLLASGCATSSTSMAGAAASMSTLDKMRSTKTILLGYRESSVPFSFVGPDGKPAGYSVDLCAQVVAAFQRDLQIPDLAVKWVPVTVENRMTAVSSGTVDLECGSTTNTLSRQAQVDFSLTIYITGGSLLALKDTPLADMNGLKIAVIPGTTTEKELKDAFAKMPANVQLIPVKDHAEGRAALENRTADTYASDRDILVGLALAAKDPSRFVLADRYFSYEPYALMMRRNDPDFRIAVNRVLARLYRSGQVLDIYARWLGVLGSPAALQIATYAIEGIPD